MAIEHLIGLHQILDGVQVQEQMRHEPGHTIVEFPAQPLPFLYHGFHGQDVLLWGQCLSLESP
jgi:hypothetical protein